MLEWVAACSRYQDQKIFPESEIHRVIHAYEPSNCPVIQTSSFIRLLEAVEGVSSTMSPGKFL